MDSTTWLRRIQAGHRKSILASFPFPFIPNWIGKRRREAVTLRRQVSTEKGAYPVAPTSSLPFRQEAEQGPEMKGKEERGETGPEGGRFNSRARPVIAHYNYALRSCSCGLCRGPGQGTSVPWIPRQGVTLSLHPPIRAPPRYPVQQFKHITYKHHEHKRKNIYPYQTVQHRPERGTQQAGQGLP